MFLKNSLIGKDNFVFLKQKKRKIKYKEIKFTHNTNLANDMYTRLIIYII